MFKRIDKLLIPLPESKYADANAAAAVQELLGGKFGEMSTLNNYMFQSFHFRGKKKLKPFYDLVSNITAEEFAHVELITTAINLCLTGTTYAGDPDVAPMSAAKDKRNSQHFIAAGQTALVQDSMGKPWSGDYVFSSGNLILDLLHNFFLECGARTNKMRVYEMIEHPTAREAVGYLLVRGGVHVVAYARALEIATGVDVTKLIPIPSLSNQAFDVARKFEQQGSHLKLYRFSDNDYQDLNKIWKGTHPEDGQPLVVVDAIPEGGPVPDLDEVPEEFAPGIGPAELQEIYARLMRSAGL